MIEALIDKQDSFEIVRDKIAQILVTETASQMALATTAGKDPELWNLKVYRERANPWEAAKALTPIVNIWYESLSFDRSGSNSIDRQTADGIFNIDCYGFGKSRDIEGGGHTPGDEEAAFSMQRALRLVRNILMAAEYIRLDLQGLVGERWPMSVTAEQVPTDATTTTRAAAARIAFRVKFNEFSPQISPTVLELITTEVKRLEDGQIIIEADYDYT